MTPGVHLFPYRTQKLSPVVPKIVGWRRPVKIGRCQHFIFSSIAQSVERMTVNHDVTGSSPVGGAKKNRVANAALFFCVHYFSTTGLERRKKKTVQCDRFPAVGFSPL